MNKTSGSTEQWLQLIGKDKLQTFQDNFARAYGVSVIFIDTAGHPLTVWSQASLFCHAIQKDHLERCTENAAADLETILKGKPFMHVCPFGITCMYIPVFFGEKLVSCAAIGGFTYEGGPLAANLRERFHISTYQREKAENVLQLLDSALKLLNINTAVLAPVKAAAQAPQKPARLRDDRISKREHEIVQLLCKGLSNRDIATQLFISETTVKTHISNILAKLNLHDRMQIIVHYYNKADEAKEETD